MMNTTSGVDISVPRSADPRAEYPDPLALLSLWGPDAYPQLEQFLLDEDCVEFQSALAAAFRAPNDTSSAWQSMVPSEEHVPGELREAIRRIEREGLNRSFPQETLEKIFCHPAALRYLHLSLISSESDHWREKSEEYWSEKLGTEEPVSPAAPIRSPFSRFREWAALPLAAAALLIAILAYFQKPPAGDGPIGPPIPQVQTFSALNLGTERLQARAMLTFAEHLASAEFITNEADKTRQLEAALGTFNRQLNLASSAGELDLRPQAGGEGQRHDFDQAVMRYGLSLLERFNSQNVAVTNSVSLPPPTNEAGQTEYYYAAIAVGSLQRLFCCPPDAQSRPDATIQIEVQVDKDDFRRGSLIFRLAAAGEEDTLRVAFSSQAPPIPLTSLFGSHTAEEGEEITTDNDTIEFRFQAPSDGVIRLESPVRQIRQVFGNASRNSVVEFHFDVSASPEGQPAVGFFFGDPRTRMIRSMPVRPSELRQHVSLLHNLAEAETWQPSFTVDVTGAGGMPTEDRVVTIRIQDAYLRAFPVDQPLNGQSMRIGA